MRNVGQMEGVLKSSCDTKNLGSCTCTAMSLGLKAEHAGSSGSTSDANCRGLGLASSESLCNKHFSYAERLKEEDTGKSGDALLIQGLHKHCLDLLGPNHLLMSNMKGYFDTASQKMQVHLSPCILKVDPCSCLGSGAWGQGATALYLSIQRHYYLCSAKNGLRSVPPLSKPCPGTKFSCLRQGTSKGDE